jgi:hypothetical protein
MAFDSDGLHVLAGVMLQIAAATVLRSSFARWQPWLIVLALNLANETVDLWIEQRREPELTMQWGESVKDLLLTLALSTTLMVVARRWPKLLVQS